MKKNLKKIIICIIVLAIIIYGFILIKNKLDKKKEQDRYAEIKESVIKAVEWEISAQYPGCTISKEFKETERYRLSHNSPFLINNGYIKKSELLDVDGKSYCDVYVKINPYYENDLDHQHNCEVYYKIYLKCKNYEDKGYFNWGY